MMGSIADVLAAYEGDAPVEEEAGGTRRLHFDRH
jgi:hypothetical protein